MSKCWLASDTDTNDDMHPRTTNVRVYLDKQKADAWAQERNAAIAHRRAYNVALYARFNELRAPEDIAYQKIPAAQQRSWWSATVTRLSVAAREHADRLFPDLASEPRDDGLGGYSFDVNRVFAVEEIELDAVSK